MQGALVCINQMIRPAARQHIHTRKLPNMNTTRSPTMEASAQNGNLLSIFAHVPEVSSLIRSKCSQICEARAIITPTQTSERNQAQQFTGVNFQPLLCTLLFQYRAQGQRVERKTKTPPTPIVNALATWRGLQELSPLPVAPAKLLLVKKMIQTLVLVYTRVTVMYTVTSTKSS